MEYSIVIFDGVEKSKDTFTTKSIESVVCFIEMFYTSMGGSVSEMSKIIDYIKTPEMQNITSHVCDGFFLTIKK